jgi:predicted metal-dependent enzyme (double-stranded beta helix superfamily)
MDTAVRAAVALSPVRLGQMVAAIAASPGDWSELVRFDPAHRWYHRLELADDHEVWLLSWLPGQETGFHDHGYAAGAFAVADGELRERTAAVGLPQVASRAVRAGGVRSFGHRHVHDVSNACAGPALSIHAYSPPLTAMRRYEMTSAGLVQTVTQNAEQDW